MLVEKYAPHTTKELALHHSKLREVEDVIARARDEFTVVRVVGPSGSGKRAAFRVCLGQAEVVCWSTFDVDLGLEDTFLKFIQSACICRGDYIQPHSAMKSTLRAVWIDDFPSTVYRTDSVAARRRLRATLQSVARRQPPGCLLLFFSDDTTLQEVLVEVPHRQLRFNAIAKSFLIRRVQTVCRGEALTFDESDPFWSNLITCGNIRDTLNQLEMMVIDRRDPPHNCPVRQAPLDFFHSLGSILWCKRQVPLVTEPCRKIEVPSCPISGFPLYAPCPPYWSPLTGRLLLASLKDRRKRQPPPLPRRSKRLSFSNDYLDRLDSYFDDFDELGDLCAGGQSTQQSLDDYLAELDDFDFNQRPDDNQWALFPSIQVHPVSDLRLKPTAEFAQLPFHMMFPKDHRPPVKSAVEQTFMRLAKSHGDVLGMLVANYLSFVGDIADAAVVADTVTFLDQVQRGSRGSSSFAYHALSVDVPELFMRRLQDSNMHPRSPCRGVGSWVRPDGLTIKRAERARRRTVLAAHRARNCSVTSFGAAPSLWLGTLGPRVGQWPGIDSNLDPFCRFLRQISVPMDEPMCITDLLPPEKSEDLGTWEFQ